MFNLPAFIRQLLPPLRRVPLLGALVNVLFGGVPKNQDDLVKSHGDAVDSINTTGQTAVLTDLLNKAMVGHTTGVLYIAEALSANTDFQVVVPPDLSDADIEQVRALVYQYKLAGKRFAIVRGADYSFVDNGGPLGFSVVPYISKGSGTDSSFYLRYGLNRNSTQRVVVKSGDQVLYDQAELFFGQADDHAVKIPDPLKAYTLTVGTMSFTVVPKAETISDVAGYRWGPGNNRTLFVGLNLTLNQAGDPAFFRVDGINGTILTKNLSEFRGNLNGIDFQFVLALPGLPSGLIQFFVQSGSVTRQWYIILTDNNAGDGNLTLGTAPANRPPTYSPLDAQSGFEGTAYQQTIPASTFTDPDGMIIERKVTGLPGGLSYVVNKNGDIVISGTPSGPGTANVSVSATDNGGSTVFNPFALTIAAKAVTAPPTTPVAGTNTYSGQNVSEAGSTNPAIMSLSSYIDADGMVGVKEGSTNAVDGDRWYLLPCRDGGGQGATGSYYTKEQMEADRWSQGTHLVFICLVMHGTPSDDQHRDGPYHAEQRIKYI